MSKKTNIKSLEEINPAGLPEAEVVDAVEAQPETSFMQTALGMYPINEDGYTKYILVEIPYNPETGKSGNVNVLYKDIREDVIDRFKSEVDQRGFFRGGRE